MTGTGGSHGREEGTASVELVAVIPFLLLAILVVAQIGLAGHALWSAGIAARAGARAALVGEDGAAAARRALPRAMRPAAVKDLEQGISVRVPVPVLLPGVPAASVGASAALGGGAGAVGSGGGG